MGLRDKMSRLGLKPSGGQAPAAGGQAAPPPAAPPAAVAAAQPPAAAVAAAYGPSRTGQGEEDTTEPAAQAPQPAGQPMAQQPTQAAAPTASQQGGGGGGGRLRRLQQTLAQSSQYAPPAFAPSQESLPAPLQRPGRMVMMAGRAIRIDDDSSAPAAVPPRESPAASALAAPTSRQQQQQVSASQQEALLFDRSAARAAVAVDADEDDFEFDHLGALRKAGISGGGKRSDRGAAVSGRPGGRGANSGGGGSRLGACGGGQLGAGTGRMDLDGLEEGEDGEQQEGEEETIRDLLNQIKPKQQGRGRTGRGGTAGTPAGAAARSRRKEVAEAEAATKAAAKKRAPRKGAAPKRKKAVSARGADEEEEGSDDTNDRLADELLLPPPSQQAQQLPPRAAAAAAAAAGSPQQQQRAHPVAANVPEGGPDEELVLRVGDDGEPWEGASEEAYLDLAVPRNINRFLRSYQREGIQFLVRQYARGMGGLLADDMGLGKTVQAIGFVAALLGKTGDESDAFFPQMEPLSRIQPPEVGGEITKDDDFQPNYSTGWPVLVVAPTSVLTNWEREFEMWGRFRVALCHGSKRDLAIAGIMKGEKEVMVVSYDTMRAMKDAILEVPWHACIFDEAHKLKNPQTATYQVACRLPTRLRFGLTGTPFQNDYSEIWALLDFLAPGCLEGRPDFMADVAVPIMRGQKSTASDIEIAMAKESQQNLRAVLLQYTLRRTKKLIAHQLPKKMDYSVFCELSPLQLAAYKRVLQTCADVQLLLNKDEPCVCGSNEKYFRCCGWKVDFDQGGVLWPIYHECECDNPYDAQLNPKGCKSHKPEGCYRGEHRMCPFCLVLPVLSILRKVSNHLELVKAEWEDEQTDPIKFEKNRAIAEMVIGTDEDQLGGYVTNQDFLRLADSATCGKMQVLEQLLDLWAQQAGSKVLLFSNSVRLLRILRSMLTGKGYDYLMLDGSVPQKDRQDLCDKFNNQPSTFLFLISTLAGGTGLNLTAANKVIIFDPSWNPASDLQAQDRAFRIGQKRDVSVYRLVAAGTMEELVYSRQIYKQQHSEMVLEGTTQPRMYKGAKTKKKEDFGELWGMVNLLKLNAQKIQTMDLLEAQRRRAKKLDIREFNVEELVAGVGASGAPAGRQQGGEDGDGDEDPGLRALVEADLARAAQQEQQGAAGEQQQQGAAGEQQQQQQQGEEEAEEEGGRCLLDEEQEAEERWEGHKQETDVLREQLGVMGLMQHSLALKPGDGEEEVRQAACKAAAASRQQRTGAMFAASAAQAPKRLKTEQAIKAAAAKAAAGGTSSSERVQVVNMSLLESLAELLGMADSREAARHLLAMTPAERSQLRKTYAREDDMALPQQQEQQEDDMALSKQQQQQQDGGEDSDDVPPWQQGGGSDGSGSEGEGGDDGGKG